MAYQFTFIDGQRVEKSVAAAFQKLRAAFKAKFGMDLLVSSGTRTRAEQAELYRLYKAGRGNLAAAPGYSNHEESGPTGPRALDLRDSGRDAGVTTIGTVRSNWLAANAPRFGFKNAGHFFRPKEGWHYEFTGQLNGGGSAPAFSALTKSTQEKLIALGYSVGVHGADGRRGNDTIAGITAFQTDQKGAAGKVDGLPGTNTTRALDAALAAKKARTAPAFPLPRGYYFGPKSGPKQSVSGYHSYRAEFRVWQQQMKNRGWPITVDGLYGTQSGDIALAFQTEKGLTRDRLIGTSTWAAAWTAPIT